MVNSAICRLPIFCKDEQLSLDVLDIAGHYAFNDADVKKELRILYENLAKHHIDGQRFVVDHIKRPLQQYAECYHLKGSYQQSSQNNRII